MFGIGFITWLLVEFAGSAAVKPGSDFEEPLAMIVGPPIYAVFANVAYTFGPLLDVIFFIGRPRIWLFYLGLIFSLALTSAPGIWAVVAWLITLQTGKKLDS
jgi:hypothetical protein